MRGRWRGVVGIALVGGALLGCGDTQPAGTQPRIARPHRLELAPPQLPVGFHKGVAIGLYGDFFWMTMRRSLEEIRDLGASHVSLVVSWEQSTVRSTDIRPPRRSRLDDARLEELIGVAHGMGLEVMLFPIVGVTHPLPGQWRGALEPRDLDAWFDSYGDFIVHHGEIAQRDGVALLSIGSELASLEPHRERWESLIERVRGVFHGELIYSANWDHYRAVPFWGLVDYVGLSGYFELTRSSDPSYLELVESWRLIQHDLAQWQPTVGRPIIFTELGYYSRDGVNRQPWNYHSDTPLDLEEQLDCYRATYEVWNGAEPLAGVYLWQWWGFGGPTNGDYTPRGKPAEDVLRRWYSGGSAGSR